MVEEGWREGRGFCTLGSEEEGGKKGGREGGRVRVVVNRYVDGGEEAKQKGYKDKTRLTQGNSSNSSNTAQTRKEYIGHTCTYNNNNNQPKKNEKTEGSGVLVCFCGLGKTNLPAFCLLLCCLCVVGICMVLKQAAELQPRQREAQKRYTTVG